MSNLIKVEDLTSPPEVGKFYQVLCVNDTESPKLWFPIRGPLHNDVEILGCTNLHWHYDWRFMSIPLMMSLGMTPFDERDIEDAPLRIFVKLDADKIEYRPKKCQHSDLKFPFPSSTYATDIDGEWTTRRVRLGIIDALYQAFKGQSLECGRCPHRGYDLTQVPSSPDGKKQCPLHGLKFNKKGKVCR